jgi:hypothetical protein
MEKAEQNIATTNEFFIIENKPYTICGVVRSLNVFLKMNGNSQTERIAAIGMGYKCATQEKSYSSNHARHKKNILQS